MSNKDSAGAVVSKSETSYGSSRILEYERISAEDGSDGNLKFHFCKVLSHTRPVTSEDWFCQPRLCVVISLN